MDANRYRKNPEILVEAIKELSLCRTVDEIASIVRHYARQLTGADGATFVLREGDLCYYADEEAIAPLWKGKRFPLSACISGWTMLNRQTAVIADIYQDSRIPHDAYRPTFVKSLVMVPIRKEQPLGSIGNYWASPRAAHPDEIEVLEALADSTSIALENVQNLQNLQKSQKELERQLTLREDFIAVLAHELRTPMTPLSMQIQFIQQLVARGDFRSHPSAHELEKCLAISQRQTQEMTKLVDKLLDISRIRLGQFTFNFENDVSAQEIAEKVAEEFRPRSPSEIFLDVSDSVRGKWDRHRIGQMLAYLTSNAVKFGEGRPIEISAQARGEMACISVEDHGLGIDPENKQRIFERFERAVSINHFGGVGLGLFISKKIAEGHGGTLSVESELGRGSLFTARIPLADRR